MPEIKLIATDLDGTFLGKGCDMPEENLKAVKAAQAKGILVCACTARPFCMGKHMVKKGGFDDLCVINNGAAVVDASTGRQLYRKGIPPEYFRGLLEAAISFDAMVQSWNHEFVGLYSSTMGDRGLQRLQEWTNPNYEMHCEMRVYDTVENMDLGCRDVAEKLMIWMDYRHAKEVEQALSKVCDVEITSSFSGLIEVTMPGATKGQGLRRMAELYGIAPEHVMAVGDNFNDIGMLEFAGIKVAVGNCEESLRKVAQYVVASNLEAGFAQAVYELAL